MNHVAPKSKIELQKLYEERTHASFVDALTGLFNYGFFSSYLAKEIQRSRRTGEKFTLCLLDIDEFGNFNRKHGEIEGDTVLRNVGHILAKSIRGSDITARLSADLFAILMTSTDTGSATTAMERITSEISDYTGGLITTSCGLATCPTHGLDKETLLNSARDALIKAKIKGGDKICVYKAPEKTHRTNKSRILVVDDEPLNLKLFEALLTPLGYEVVTAESGQKALSVINKTEIDLILLDVMMPGINGFEICRILKSREDTRLIPVIMITALNDIEAKVQGIESGADDFISKPPNKFELTTRIKSLLRARNLNKSLTSIENVLISLANAVEAKDAYTQGHIERVSTMALSLGKLIGIPEQELKALRMGCILHDIGKISIPREVLNKPGKLNEKEWQIMKEHPIIGYKICLPLQKTLGPALEVIRHHHEKMDGSGYPDGLAGSEISTIARIASIVDIYDALTTDRPYRKSLPRNEAVQILIQEKNNGKLDPYLVQTFVRLIEKNSQ